MKLALLGTGMIVHTVLPVLESLDIRPCAILGTPRSRQRALDLAEQFHIPHVFFDYEDLLRSDIDTVYVGLPNALHYTFARQALLAGKHVILEKPMVTRLGELEALCALARERDLLLLEAMMTHALPAFGQLRQDLPLLGKMRMVCMTYCQYSSRYDAFLRGETPSVFDPALAGGALMDLNIYNIHAVAALFGLPRSAVYSPTLQRGVDTGGVLSLDYGDMKAVCIACKDCQGSNYCLFDGEQGYLQFSQPVGGLDRYELRLRSGEHISRAFPMPGHPTAYEFARFRDIIDGRDRAAAEALLSISLTAQRILEMALT